MKKVIKVNRYKYIGSEDSSVGTYVDIEPGSRGDIYTKQKIDAYKFIGTIDQEIEVPDTEEMEWQWLYRRKINNDIWRLTRFYKSEEDMIKEEFKYFNINEFDVKFCPDTARPIAKKTVRKEVDARLFHCSIDHNAVRIILADGTDAPSDIIPSDATNIKVSYDTKE